MLIGYARISTQDQKLQSQLSALKEVGCKKIYEDRVSGIRINRPGLKLALEVLRKGDTLVVWKLDRLGRTVKGLIDLANQFQSKGIHFKSITDNVDTSTPAGRFFFHMMASFAEMERELITERTKAGLAAARKQGKVGGRPRKMTNSKIKSAKKLRQAGVPIKNIAKDLGISVPTLYRWIPASSVTEA